MSKALLLCLAATSLAPFAVSATVDTGKLFKVVPSHFQHKEIRGGELPAKSSDDRKGFIKTPGPLIAIAARRYLSRLESHPISTKGATAAAVTALGDQLAQKIEGRSTLDLRRTLSFGLSGGVYAGPFVHFLFTGISKFVSSLEKRSAVFADRNIRALISVSIDQTLGSSLYFPLYFFVFNFFESVVNGNPHDIGVALERIRNEGWAVLIMSWRIYPFINYVNFRYVPADLRVLFSNVIGVFWNCFLCSRIS